MKLQALAARQVTKELRTHSIWSWGWATFSAAGIDPDKGEAVCVYLWVRDQKLCSGPGAAGPAMDASLTVGQLEQLGAGVVCALPAGEIRKSAVDPLARAIGDRDIAASVVLERLVLQQEVELDARAVLAAELAFVDDHFSGSVASYLAALRRIRLTRRRGARAAAGRAPARRRPRALLHPPPDGRRGRGVPRHLRRPAGAARRDRASRRLARRQDARDRGRDLRPGADLRPCARRPRPDVARADRR